MATEEQPSLLDTEIPSITARKKRLSWILVALAANVLALLATLALPWKLVTLKTGTVKLGAEIISYKGGSEVLSGINAGGLQPILIAAVLALVTGFSCWKRRWIVGLLVTIVLIREGISVPSFGARGANTVATDGQGLELVRVLWPLLLVLLALVTLQSFLVRQAEKNSEKEISESNQHFTDTITSLKKVIVGGIAGVQQARKDAKH